MPRPPARRTPAGRRTAASGCHSRWRTASRACAVTRSSGRNASSTRELGLGRRRVEDPEPAGDLGGLGDVLVAAGLVERQPTVGLVGAQEAVDLRDVDPHQQVRVGGGVRRAVVERAGDAVVDRADGVDRLLRVVGGAERGDREEAAGAGEPAPHVAAVARVLGHGGHRRRVQGLEQHRPDAADEHRRVAVHAADRAGGVEPARAGRAVDAVAVPGSVGPGDAG